jgi:thiamine-phosphate pyrophosphorylase
MILVITPETIVQNETEIINQMFQEGLELLHVRKLLNREEMNNFLQSINKEFYPRLVLHSYHDLGKEHSIFRFHFRETDRLAKNFEAYRGENIISTSVHDIEMFNALEKEWEYAFISPVFQSISKKGYGEKSSIMEDIIYRNNHEVKLIALGGINEKNISTVFEKGADGAALLGAIWESDQPLNTFKKCRRKALLI